MIIPNIDLYARLVLSAKTNLDKNPRKVFNRPILKDRNLSVVLEDNELIKNAPNNNDTVKKSKSLIIEPQKNISEIRFDDSSLKLKIVRPKFISVPKKNELIEDKVVKLVDNEEIKTLKLELLELENRLNVIKKTHDKLLVNRLKSKISEIKKLIEQKTYV